MLILFLIFTVCSAAPHNHGRFSQILKNISQQAVSDLLDQQDLGTGGDVDQCKQCAEVDIPVIYASASNILAGELVDEFSDGSYTSVEDCVARHKECMEDCGQWGWWDVCGFCLLGKYFTNI